MSLLFLRPLFENKVPNELNKSGNSRTSNLVQGTLLCGTCFYRLIKIIPKNSKTPKDQGSLNFLTQRLLWSSRDVFRRHYYKGSLAGSFLLTYLPYLTCATLLYFLILLIFLLNNYPGDYYALHLQLILLTLPPY
jgi:hypothetical protein